MSFDIQIAFPCPHQTIEEHVHLGSDRRSLETRQPVASFGSVRITANNGTVVPSKGVYSPATVTGFLSGPFQVVGNAEILTVSNRTEEISVTLPVGTRIKTDAVVTLFLQGDPQTISVVNRNGHLSFTDLSSLGLSSDIRVSGSAAIALGFDKQRGARGRQIYPAWVLAKREDTITNRFPKFIDLVSNSPVFKVSYTVPRERCLRCRGTYVENDYRFDAQGHTLTVQDENLLYQMALKAVLTELGSNAYHSWYGTTISTQIGEKNLGGVGDLITEEIKRSLGQMQALQLEQSKYQEVTFKERLYQVTSIQTFASEDNPFAYFVEVAIQNASSDPIVLTIVYTVPGVASLVEGNNTRLQLG